MTTATIIMILWPAICAVESSNNANATTCSAVGIAQITPICIREANRIVGCDRYSLEDRLSPERSEEIFEVTLSRHLPTTSPTLRDGALVWRCGADRQGRGGARYWKKIQEEVE